jgi:foldase protein PrsA
MLDVVLPPSLRSGLRSGVFVLSTVVAMALGACGTSNGGGAGSTAAASVNGSEISQTELQNSLPLFKFLASLSQAPCGQQDPQSSESADAACSRFALGNLIQEEILQQYATAHHITIEPDKVDSTIKQLEGQLGGAEKLDSLLKQNGVTRPELEAFAGRLLLFQDVQKEIGQGQVDEAQLRQTYEQNKLQYTQLDTWQILVKSQQQADSIERQVTPGNFMDLADKYSIDPSVKQNHGDLGTMDASQLVEPYVRAALALQPGEISQPVQSQFGWHIIRLISAKVAPFEQVRDQIAQQSSGQSFQTWFQSQLTQSTIRVNPRYGRFDPSTGNVNPVHSTASGSASPSPAGATGSSPTGATQGGSPTP